MRYLILASLIIIFAENSNAQKNGETATGKVSYVSSQNVYVKFESTKNISIGDTLFVTSENLSIPALIVTNMSSTSCVCSSIAGVNINLALEIVAKHRDKTAKVMNKIAVIKDNKLPPSHEAKDSVSNVKTKQSEFKEKINGSISASSYSNFSSINTTNSNRFQYNLTLNALNINNSRLSFETYTSFRYNQNEWNLVKKDIFHALRFYSLNVKYDITKNTQFSFGRRVNSKISSIGAIDGVQFETKINRFSLGAFLGSRPNYIDYNFDLTLPQFGAYIAHSFKMSNGEMQNTFALVNQMNNSKTDRRFAYFQHSNSLIKNLYFYSSFEIDLYKNINNKAQNTFSLTSSYLSLNYRVWKRLSFSTSYDIRKSVIYYETYKNLINQFIETQARQGLSFQANYNSLKNIYFGIRTGYRFPSNNSKASKNIYGYVTFSRIPILNISTTLATTWLQSDYLTGKIYYMNMSREFFHGKFYSELGYQYVDYNFGGALTSLKQNIADISISWRIYKKLSSSIKFEETFENRTRYSRLNFQIIQRF